MIIDIGKCIYLETRYVLREDFPYCIKCYENVFANNCDECGKIIGIDSKVTKRIKLIFVILTLKTHRVRFSTGITLLIEFMF